MQVLFQLFVSEFGRVWAGLIDAAAARAQLGLTSTGSAVATATDPAAARTAIGLGSMATQNANAVAITGGTGSLTSLNIAGTTPSTSTTTGAVVIPNGGLGVGGQISATNLDVVNAPYQEITFTNLTFWLNNATGNDSNPGTQAQPFRTFARAFQEAGKYTYINCSPTIRVVGNYPITSTVVLPQLNTTDAFLVGDEANPNNCVISGPVNLFLNASAVKWRVRGFRLAPTVSTVDALTALDAYLSFGQCVFNGGRWQVYAYGPKGFITNEGRPYTIEAGAARHTNQFDGSTIQITGGPVTVVNNITFTAEFSFCNVLGRIIWIPTITGGGVISGRRYRLETGAQRLGTPPGTIDGIETQYVADRIIFADGSTLTPNANGDLVFTSKNNNPTTIALA